MKNPNYPPRQNSILPISENTKRVFERVNAKTKRAFVVPQVYAVTEPKCKHRLINSGEQCLTTSELIERIQKSKLVMNIVHSKFYKNILIVIFNDGTQANILI